MALDGDSCLVEAPKLDPSRARWAAGKSDITTKQQLHFFLSLSLSPGFLTVSRPGACACCCGCWFWSVKTKTRRHTHTQDGDTGGNETLFNTSFFTRTHCARTTFFPIPGLLLLRLDGTQAGRCCTSRKYTHRSRIEPGYINRRFHRGPLAHRLDRTLTAESRENGPKFAHENPPEERRNLDFA